MRYLLDASALLALMLDEPGADRVALAMGAAAIGSANLAEVATVMVRRNGVVHDLAAVIAPLRLPVFVLETETAILAGALSGDTRALGLSLGDRCCLALASKLSATVLTSDARLAQAAPRAGVTASLIR